MTVILESKVLRIRAVKWYGDNVEEIKEFVGVKTSNGESCFLLPDENSEEADNPILWNEAGQQWISVPDGCWILKGLVDEFYPCAEHALFAKYDIVDIV